MRDLHEVNYVRKCPLRYRVVLESAFGLLVLFAWLFAIWMGYVNAPAARRRAETFDVPLGTLPTIVLTYGGVLLPATAALGLVIARRTKSRTACNAVLLGLPIVVGIAQLALIINQTNLYIEMTSQ